jgi:hypothetical protein
MKIHLKFMLFLAFLSDFLDKKQGKNCPKILIRQSQHTVYASSPYGGSGYTNRQSGVRWVLERFERGLFRHILQALQTLRVCLFGLAKRRIPFRVMCHMNKKYSKI